MSSRFPLYIIGIVLFASFFSCTDMVPTKEVRLIDSLNGKAYTYRGLGDVYKRQGKRILIVIEAWILLINMPMKPIDR